MSNEIRALRLAQADDYERAAEHLLESRSDPADRARFERHLRECRKVLARIKSDLLGSARTVA